MKKILKLGTIFCFFIWSQILKSSDVIAAPGSAQGQISLILMKKDFGFYQPLNLNAESQLLSSDQDIEVRRVILKHEILGNVRILLKGPKDFFTQQDHANKAMIIVSGFFTGEKSIHLIGDISDRVLVGFEYPYSLDDFKKDPGAILQFVRKTPGQIALALFWLSQQAWINTQGLAVMGVSLGGVFLPAGIHIAQDMGVVVEKSIFVGTGSELGEILKENLSNYLDGVVLDSLTQGLILPTVIFDPKLHLPFLKGPFLIIQTDKDTVIPKSSKDKLFEALSEPKKEVVLPGPHVNSDQLELIKKIQEVVVKELK
ncbi:MAG: hypothetical protein L6Q37_02010 [Bdellovibrionaceae bacterium]|nr:hypothetical protein [Pseudobdellovibrionaceae bacterium]NUM60167.1 hypothetical protein [Pseudobdellovibrionaceae bacterium]